MNQPRTYSKLAVEAALLLGSQIQLLRKEKLWTEQNLADRAGISRTTLQKIEQGQLTPTIGLVFEVAVIVGISLFEQNQPSSNKLISQTQDKIALLPKRARKSKKVVDDDF